MNVQTWRKAAQSTSNELLPRWTVDPVERAIVNLSSVAWWDANQGDMEGVALGSPLSFAWKDRKANLRAVPANSSQVPAALIDAGTGQGYVAMGYGAGLSQRTTVGVQVEVHQGGTGHVAGDTVTLTDGTVVQVASTLSGAIVTATLVSSTTYTSAPANPVAQASSTGSGTGATFDIDCSTTNGSLITPASSPLITLTGPATLVAVARIPTVGGRAGSNPGGTLLADQLPNSAYADVAANLRSLSLGVGYGSNGGRAVFRLNGESKLVAGPTGTDYRDDHWHVFMGCYTPSGGSTTPVLYVDGQVLASTTLSSLAINTTPGSTLFRAGALGASSMPAVLGLAGDLALFGVIGGLDFSQSANATMRQMVNGWLMGRFSIAGTPV